MTHAEKNDDTRNVTDEFKHQPHETIVAELDKRGVKLEIAIENLERDFNMGTIVRSANAFGVRTVHIIGRRQWNKRGAMATDKYLQVKYHQTTEAFVSAAQRSQKAIVAVDNIPGAVPLGDTVLPDSAVLVFGSEAQGVSDELADEAIMTVAIEQIGSTRSINVGVAAGIVMYEWLRQHALLQLDPAKDKRYTGGTTV